MIGTLKLLAFIEALQVLSYWAFRSSLKANMRKVIQPADFVLMLLIPLVGLFAHTVTVFYVFVLVLPLISIGNPVKLASRYVLLLPLFPALLTVYTVGGLYVGSVTAILFFNLGALLALACTHRSRTKPVAVIDICAWIVFFLLMLMTARGAPLNDVVRMTMTSYLAVLPPFYVMARCVNSGEAARRVFIFLVFAAFTNAIIAVFEALRHWPLYQAFYSGMNIPVFGLSGTLSIRAGLMRSQSAVGNVAALGLLLGLAPIMMIALRSCFRPGWRIGIMAALVLGLGASQSRGGWLAAVIGLVLYLVYMRRFTVIARLAPVAAIFLLAWGLTSRGSKLGELVGKSGHGELTADYRSDLFHRGLQEIARHPMTGQTRAQLEVSMDDLRQGEHIIDFVNTHLTVALVVGLGGLVLWIIAWSMPFIRQWQARPRGSVRLVDPLAGLPFAMIGACFACLIFTSMIDRLTSLSMISIGLASAWLRLGLTRSGGAQTNAQPGRVDIARHAGGPGSTLSLPPDAAFTVR